MNTSSRREFLQAATIGASACCFGAINFIETGDMLSFQATSFGDKNFITVPTKKFPEPIFIGKQTDGSYVALRLYCPHKGCGLNVAPDKLVCPCHGSEFSLQGAVLHGPAIDSLQSFHVSIEAQNVIVHFN